MRILSTPEQVCFEHALEFWKGLLVYAIDRSEPCVKHEQICSCPRCEEQSAAYLRASALEVAIPSPPDHADFAILLAS